MGRDPNNDGEGSKNGLRRGDPKLNCVFSTSPACLRLSVAYRYLKKEISDFEIELRNLLPKVTHTISNDVCVLGRGVSTKLRFRSP